MTDIADRDRASVVQLESAGLDEQSLALGVLEGDLGFFCRLAQLHFFNAFFDDFRETCLSPAELSVLMTISENPGVRQGVLADVLLIKRSAMTKLMRGLEDSGLVTRISPRSDLRSVELTLTREGEALAAKAKARMKGHGDRATPMLSSDERKLLIGLLKKVTGRD